MYRINTPTGESFLTEKPNYIRKHSNNCFILTDAARAQGVAYHGTPYMFADGTICYEVDGGQEIKQTEETNAIVFVTLAEAGSIDDVTAAEHAALFAEWTYPVKYSPGQLRIDPLDGCLYRVNEAQGHTSQQGWNPSLTSALWTKAADPAEEWPEWSQPIGKDDAYKMGAKVSHNGKRWICDAVDAAGNNVWEPGVYGWTEYIEEVL